MAVAALPQLDFRCAARERQSGDGALNLRQTNRHLRFGVGSTGSTIVHTESTVLNASANVSHRDKERAPHTVENVDQSTLLANLIPARGAQSASDPTFEGKKVLGSFANLVTLFSGVATAIDGSDWAVSGADLQNRCLDGHRWFYTRSANRFGTSPLLQIDMGGWSVYLSEPQYQSGPRRCALRHCQSANDARAICPRRENTKALLVLS